MRKKIMASLIILIVFISGCTDYSQNQQTSQPSLPDNILIKDFAFNPHTLIIKAGTTVTWINEDSAPHNIKSVMFNSENLNTGSSFRYTINNTGTYEYTCGIHQSMKGKIIVE